MSKLKPGAGKKAKHTSYSMLNKATINKQKRVAKHLRKHPNDVQSQGATKATGHTRKKPTARLGWVKESLKATMSPTPPARHVAREYAQAVKFSTKVAHTPITKEDRKVFKNIPPFDPTLVKARNELLANEAKERKEKALSKRALNKTTK